MVRVLLRAAIAALALTASAAAAGAPDLAARIVPHLASVREEERLAALAAAAAAKDPAVSRAVLTACQRRDRLAGLDRDLLAAALVPLPVDELATALATCDEVLVDALAEAAAARPLAEAVRVVEKLGDAHAGRGDRVLAAAGRRIAPDDAAGRSRIAALLRRRADPESRVAAMRSLASPEWSAEVGEAFAADPAPVVRAALSDQLELQSRSRTDVEWARPLVVKLAGDPDVAVRAAAVKTLAGMYVRTQADAEHQRAERATLLARLDDEVPTIRVDACRWAGADHDSTINEKLVALAAQRPTALAALEALDRRDHPAVCDLAAQGVKGADRWLREVALAILARRRDPRTAELANQLLDDPDSSVRDDAAKALEAVSGVDHRLAVAVGGIGIARQRRGQAFSDLLGLEPARRLEEIERLYAGEPADRRPEFIRLVGRQRLSVAFLVRRIADPVPAVALAALQMMSENCVAGASRQTGVIEAMARLGDRDQAVAGAARRYVIGSGCRSIRVGVHLDALKDGRNVGWAYALNLFERRRPELLLPGLEHVDPANRAAALQFLDPSAWNSERVWKAALAAADSVAQLPAGAPHGAGVAALVAALRAAEPAMKPKYIAVLGRCDDPAADAALAEAANAADRAVRWAARDALAVRGDESPAVLDHALVRLLLADPARRDELPWPNPGPAALARLEALRPLAPADAVASLRAELERLIAERRAVPPAPAPDAEAGAESRRLPRTGQMDRLETVRWDGEQVAIWNPCAVVVREAGGRTQLHVESPGGGNENFGFACEVRDIAAPASFGFEIACAKPVRVAIALNTGDAFTFFESPQHDVAGDGAPHALTFDLRAADFKCQESGWKYTTTVTDLHQLRRVTIMVYAGKTACAVDVTAIAFGRGK